MRQMVLSVGLRQHDSTLIFFQSRHLPLIVFIDLLITILILKYLLTINVAPVFIVEKRFPSPLPDFGLQVFAPNYLNKTSRSRPKHSLLFFFPHTPYFCQGIIYPKCPPVTPQVQRIIIIIVLNNLKLSSLVFIALSELIHCIVSDLLLLHPSKHYSFLSIITTCILPKQYFSTEIMS